LILIFLGCALAPPPAVAARMHEDGGRHDRPEHSLVMAAEYPGVAAAGEDAEMDLIFRNKGRTDESVSLRMVQVPDRREAGSRPSATR
jgi:hypothetical protein